jgi:hypothetical protein
VAVAGIKDHKNLFFHIFVLVDYFESLSIGIILYAHPDTYVSPLYRFPTYPVAVPAPPLFERGINTEYGI